MLKKKYTKFIPKVKSRHPSHSILKESLPLLPFRSIVRLGSTTNIVNDFDRVECNTIQAIKNSSNKYLMKECFTENNIKTSEWWFLENILTDSGEINYYCGFQGDMSSPNDNNCYHAQLPYPIIAKHIYGSRGTGNYKLDNKESLEAWLVDKDLDNYIFEKFYSYNKEYRLHVSKNGCFYTCRKLLKQDTHENKRWFRNDSNCTWILETNPKFDKPKNWQAIVEESVNALNSVGLDIGAIDVKVQSKLDNRGRERENPEFIILETNSAPSFGEITCQKYIEEIPIVLIQKYNLNR